MVRLWSIECGVVWWGVVGCGGGGCRNGGGSGNGNIVELVFLLEIFKQNFMKIP